jgi:xylulokinase
LQNELYVGIDASTTACKAIAFDASGRDVAEGRAPIELFNPEPDGWEQDANQWWNATASALRALAHTLGPQARAVRALGLTHQRETFVLTDASGTPLHPALVWMDARCRAAVARAKARVGDARLHELSGKPACTTPSLYKLLYLLEEKAPELARRELRVLDVHGFLAWRLTGRCATSLASADPLGLVDMRARSWSEELLSLAGLGLDHVAELVEPGSVLGGLTEDAAAACGFEAGTPVVAGAGDGQAAGLGAGIVAPGRAYLNLGTAIVSGVLSTEYRIDAAFRTLYGPIAGTFFLESDLKGGTFTLSWLVERLLRQTRPADEVLAELEQAAALLPPGADGLLLVPYWNGVMNPYWDDDATGAVIGWHGAHGPAHLYRAILEGIALEERLHSRGMEQAVGRIEELVVMGGGSKSELWCRILSDVLERRIVRSRTAEATALGAAMLAAVASGAFSDAPAASQSMSGTAAAFEPGPDCAFYAKLFEEGYAAAYPALREILGKLVELRAYSANRKRTE